MLPPDTSFKLSRFGNPASACKLSTEVHYSDLYEGNLLSLSWCEAVDAICFDGDGWGFGSYESSAPKPPVLASIV